MKRECSDIHSVEVLHTPAFLSSEELIYLKEFTYDVAESSTVNIALLPGSNTKNGRASLWHELLLILRTRSASKS